MNFFSRAVHRPAQEPNVALVILHVHFIQFLTFFFLILIFVKGTKNRFPYSRTQIQYFLLQTQVFSKFFSFSLVHSKLELFFYHHWNFHFIIASKLLFMQFLRKLRSNIYLNKKLLRKRNFQKSFKLFFSEIKYFVYVQLFSNSRFSQKLSVTVNMVWLYNIICNF